MAKGLQAQLKSELFDGFTQIHDIKLTCCLPDRLGKDCNSRKYSIVVIVFLHTILPNLPSLPEVVLQARIDSMKNEINILL